MSYLSKKLKSISEELEDLADLVGEREGPSLPLEAPIDPEAVRRILRVRRLRDQFFTGNIFPDPAWDILLDLFAARMEGKQVSISSACAAASVPPTTALRWVERLEKMGLAERAGDPKDGRRIYIALSDTAASKMKGFFARARASLNDPLV
ncbi:MAG TPA: winged helix DNA-binding protein [Allosphingosinicella sp.]|nr:winged helix DNA-binding protein [Allosphingosinicella sp.]